MDPKFCKRYRWAALTLIAVAAVFRLLYLAWYCPLDLAPDEAHYWDWSRQLDWCYYSKGPLVAWLIRLSCEILGATPFAVRLPAVVCGSLLLLGLYVLTALVHASEKLACAVVALALTLPVVAAGSSLMTIDAPFICAWIWALVFGYRAVFHQSPWAWPAAGLCILLGLLAKHTMILWLPSFALFLLATPAQRQHLARPGFWIMTGVGCLGGVPILAWNALNGWVTLKHTQLHVGLENESWIDWLGPVRYLGGQFAVLLGFWFVAWLRAVWHHRPTRERRAEWLYLWWMSVPTVIFFGLFSVKNGGGEANWPLAAYLAGMVLVAGWLADEWRREQSWSRRIGPASIAAISILGLLLTSLFHEPTRMQPVLLRLAGPATPQQPMPIRRLDPTSRLRGWRHLAAEVDRIRAELAASGIEPVLAAERWTQTSELRFYCAEHPAVFCLGPLLGDRYSQYDVWRPNPVWDAADFRGRTFLLVGADLDRLRPAFASFASTRTVVYRENNEPIAAWEITVAHGFRGHDSKKMNPN